MIKTLYKIINKIRLGNYIENFNARSYGKNELEKELQNFSSYDHKIENCITLNIPPKFYSFQIIQ
jgi:hypothetical protein